MKSLFQLAIIVAFAVMAFFFYVNNPYVNGVAYTKQRECEKNVLTSFAFKIAESRAALLRGEIAPSFNDLLVSLPRSETIDCFADQFMFEWNIVEADEYRIGDTDASIVLSRSVDLAALPSIHTPLLIHISSSFTEPNNNLLLLVAPDAQIRSIGCTDTELQTLLTLPYPDGVTEWVAER